ncbi:hypothetical protein FGG08_003056 [Glutinoglossum americanum]|uniref:TFIID subunit TAF5 NTD2 domain-containing protein n=1 Tax=Glutinoglossum americanum TaxID=1670608 RepID=A0A9P8I830_9PEZI|nr:hypothetical protein FGG08_003056 [Glutinoglossum americanum]
MGVDAPILYHRTYPLSSRLTYLYIPSTLFSVIEYLSKKGYSRTEAMLRMESANTDREGRPLIQRAEDLGGDKYFKAFELARGWIEENLDIYKPELKRILYPLFIYSYLNLLADCYKNESQKFFNAYKDLFIRTHESDLRVLNTLSLPEHVNSNNIAQVYRTNKYRVTLSPQAYYNLLQFLEAKDREGGTIVLSILQHHCNIRTAERGGASGSSLSLIGAALGQGLKDEDVLAEDEGIPGHNPGSANMTDSSSTVLVRLRLGHLPMDPDLASDVQNELQDLDAKNPPGEGQNTLVQEFETHIKREQSDDTPSREDMPLPPYTARDVAMEVQKVRENRDRFKIEGKTGGTGPGLSVVMFTWHNTYDSINCLDFSEDNLFAAAGTSESYIRVWSLEGRALQSILPQAADTTPLSSSRRLIGHSGPIYAVSFSPSAKNEDPDPIWPSTAPRYLVSCSADKTVRLWSLDTWTNLVIYKGHDDPVWDVTWCPFGYYFLTGSHDKTARLWSTDHISFLRMFAGHDQDVDTVCFHPNSVYVFTGSSDKTVRMWSIQTGSTVRLFTGHTGNLTSIACSPDGKTLASAADDGFIILWDLASGRRLKVMRGHSKGGIWSLSWSVESSVLVSGGADGTVRVWDVAVGNEASGPQGKVIAEGGAGTKIDGGATGAQGGSAAGGTAGVANANAGGGGKKKGKEVVVTPDQISAFPTKKSPIYKVKFTRKNLVVAGGAYLP